jgi:hypothetical protein
MAESRAPRARRPGAPKEERRKRAGTGLSLVLCASLAGASLEGAILPGDINSDGSIDITDVLNLFFWLGSNEVDGICHNAADLNRDGRVDLADAVSMIFALYGSERGPGRPLPGQVVASCRDAESSLGLGEVRSVVLGPESAMVTWLTAHPSSSTVRYGWSGSLDLTADVDESVLYHQVVLKGLLPGRIYYYQVVSAAPGHETERSFIESFRTLALADYSIRPDHPRIFFTREEIPELRRRIKGPAHDGYWRLSERYCENFVDLPLAELVKLDSFDDRIKAFAFVGLIGNYPAFRKKAIDAALYIAANGAGGGDVRAETESMAFVYDWLHVHLSAEARGKLIEALVRKCRDLGNMIRDDEYVTGASHGHNKSLAIAALAFHGDHPSAAEIIEKTVRDYRYGFLATWRRFAGADGGSSKGWWYSSYVLPFELEFLSAWRSATGQDWYREEAGWCAQVLDWFVYGLRGDLTFLREGDANVFKGLGVENRLYANIAAREYRSQVARWFADRTEDLDVVWGPFGIREVLWHDPSIEPAPPSGPTSKIFRSAGVAILRESWDLDAAIASFRSAEAYTQGHTHRDSSSFTIYHRGALAIDSGIYDDFSSSHHDNYYSRTVAHNSITVFDPDEKFVKYGIEYANDGGQRWLAPGEDVENAWPSTPEDTIDRSRGYRLGGITHFEDGDRYTYVVGDGTPAYSPRKLLEFRRHFLWLRSVTGRDEPVVVVFDDVVSRHRSFAKAYLLHMENQPVISGSLVKVVNRGGALFQYTLAPAKHEIRAIGGPGKEFWVDGANYPPGRSPRENEEPGAWRVEVSPAEERTDDRFLHVIFIGKEGAAVPAKPGSFTAGGMQGCRVGEWVVLLDTEGAVANVEYDSPRRTSSHLITGAVPLAAYDVSVGGVRERTVEASFSGTLRFDLGRAGRVTIRRSPPGR